MKLESAEQSRRDRPFCFADCLRPASWIDAGERNHDVGIFCGKLYYFIIRHHRSASKPLIHGKNDASDIPGAIVFRHLLAPSRRGAAEVLLRRLIGFSPCSFVFDVHVDINRLHSVHVETLFIAHGSPVWIGTVRS